MVDPQQMMDEPDCYPTPEEEAEFIAQTVGDAYVESGDWTIELLCTNPFKPLDPYPLRYTFATRDELAAFHLGLEAAQDVVFIIVRSDLEEEFGTS